VKLKLKVVPKSSRNAIAGWLGERLKVCVSAPPDKGKANAAIELLLAEALDLPKGSVRIIAGHASPEKTVEIAGCTMEEIRRQLD
jgi:uncharacterized protein (TIGR00251 family)